MRIALSIALPLGAALIQASIIPLFEIAGARPNMIVLIAGSWAIATGAGEAVWWAFVAGLGADLLSGGPLGAFAAASLPAVGAIGLGERPLARPIPVVPAAVMVGVAAAAAGLIYVALLAVIGYSLPSVPTLLVQTLGGAILTGLLGLGVYPLMRKLRRATENESPF